MKVKLDFKTKKTLRSQNKSEIDFEKSDNKLSNIKRKECKRIQEYRKQLKSDPTLAERAKKLQTKKTLENKLYNEKVKERRKNDPKYDKEIRVIDRLRKQKYRKKKAEIAQKAKNAKAKAKPDPKVKKGEERQSLIQHRR